MMLRRPWQLLSEIASLRFEWVSNVEIHGLAIAAHCQSYHERRYLQDLGQTMQTYIPGILRDELPLKAGKIGVVGDRDEGRDEGSDRGRDALRGVGSEGGSDRGRDIGNDRG